MFPGSPRCLQFPAEKSSKAANSFSLADTFSIRKRCKKMNSYKLITSSAWLHSEPIPTGTLHKLYRLSVWWLIYDYVTVLSMESLLSYCLFELFVSVFEDMRMRSPVTREFSFQSYQPEGIRWIEIILLTSLLAPPVKKKCFKNFIIFISVSTKYTSVKWWHWPRFVSYRWSAEQLDATKSIYF